MSSSLNSSFIPKRNPNQNQKTTSPRSIFVGTLIVRIFFFAILISTIAVLFYKKNLDNNLVKVQKSYRDAVENFDAKSFENIKTMSNRLHQARGRLDHTVSFDAIFNLLEKTTLGTVQINHLSIKKPDDSKLTLDVDMQTDSFDAILFQRMVLGGSSVRATDGNGFEVATGESNLKVVDIRDLTINNPRTDGKSNQTLSKFSVSFKADIALDPTVVQHEIPSNIFSSSPSSTTEMQESNEMEEVKDSFIEGADEGLREDNLSN